MHDLRGWGATWNPGSGNPGVTNPNLDVGNHPVGGAITDGASICLLRLRAPTDDHAAPLRSMEAWILKRGPSPTEYQQHEALREVAGYVTNFHGGLPVLPNLPMQAEDHSEDIVGAFYEGLVFYVPPESYTDPAYLPPPPPGAAPDPKEYLNSDETCLMTLRCQVGNGAIWGGRSFILRRPPLVLVHGILSGPDTWDHEYWNEVGSPVPTRLYKVDYSDTNKQGFPENYPKVVQMIEAALDEYRSAGDAGHVAERTFNGVKYAATQADVVAHSQGGQLVRWYIADTSGKPQSQSRGGFWTAPIQNSRAQGDPQFRWPYLRSDNFGAGSIRRFIPLNSPFKGSPLASDFQDEVLEPALEKGDVFARVFAGDVAAGVVAEWRHQVDDSLTCLADLCVDSVALTWLESAPYPVAIRRVRWHPVSTEVRAENDPEGEQDPPYEWVFSNRVARTIIVNATSAQVSLRADNSDIIVPTWSQKNLDEASLSDPRLGPGTHLYGISHFSLKDGSGALRMRGATAAPGVRDVVGALLSRPGTSELFPTSWRLGE